MKNKTNNPISSLLVILSCLLLQAGEVSAEETCRGIGGTGVVANGCGVGGTGHSSTKEGIGGTGHAVPNSGVGGTGMMASKGGIGGTGHLQGEGGIGGTGIVGIITGFGSIWVNGLEVQYDAKTPVADNAVIATANDLAIGQVVTIEASGSNNEFKANKISVVDAVAGQITSIDTNTGKLIVLGQTITLSSKTIMHDQHNQANQLKLNVGDYIKVSGLRLANGDIKASRIAQTTIIAEPNLVGPVTGKSGNVIEVYGLKIVTTSSANLSIGQEVIASGKQVGETLLAREIKPSPTSELFGKTEQIRLQGYVGESSSGGQIKVGNLDVVLSAQSISPQGKMNELNSGELVQISGHFDRDNRIVADKIEFSMDRPERIQQESMSGLGGHDAHEQVERAEKAESIGMDRPDRPEHSDNPNHSNSSESSSHNNVNENSGHSH
jgi:hypothetical protein